MAPIMIIVMTAGDHAMFAFAAFSNIGDMIGIDPRPRCCSRSLRSWESTSSGSAPLSSSCRRRLILLVWRTDLPKASR